MEHKGKQPDLIHKPAAIDNNREIMRILRYCFIITLLLGLNAVAETGPNFMASAFVRPVQPDKIYPALADKIAASPQARIKIWTFFTDKGFTDNAGFRRAASSLSLTDRSMSRRAKMGLDGIVFADIPVSENYIANIENLGAEFRRSSKWLNAASFEIDANLLDRIAALPFVAEIRPVAGFKMEKPVSPSEEQLRLPPIKAQSDALNYGASFGQVSMINAPALHQMGYNGQGVVVAIFDTGFFKVHDAFAQAIADGRLLAEYDFINNDGNTQNEGDDVTGQESHGTETWSALGGDAPGHVIGPAYGATFLLAKTEDITSETPVEEDNWIAALEWADSLGADIVSSSLGYIDWYTYADLNGLTAPITLAANTAAGLGILVCNSAGNGGSGPGTINAPADAFNILSVGAVQPDRTIASFSSRGPTYDGRIKPEVCAQGVSCALASHNAVNAYTSGNGTSFSCPLVAGVAAQLLSAHPEYTPYMLRDAFMQTADRASSPDNNYGWGIIDALRAFNWGANFTVDTAFGVGSLTVQFTDSSSVTASSRTWYFGDGDSSTAVNPVHYYAAPGMYDVSLVLQSVEGTLVRHKLNLIDIVADTVQIASDSAYAGQELAISINLTNFIDLNRITIPLSFQENGLAHLDSAALGNRTAGVSQLSELYRNDATGEITFEAVTNNMDNLITAGTGEIFKLYFSTDSLAESGTLDQLTIVPVGGYNLELANDRFVYKPSHTSGQAVIRTVLRGDFNNSGTLNLLDILGMIGYLYESGSAPLTIENGDANSDNTISLTDILTLIDILY